MDAKTYVHITCDIRHKFQARRERKLSRIDPRLKVYSWSGRGEQAEFKVANHPEVVVFYDSDQHPFRWTVIKLENHVIKSGFYPSYSTSRQAVNAVEKGVYDV